MGFIEGSELSPKTMPRHGLDFQRHQLRAITGPFGVQSPVWKGRAANPEERWPAAWKANHCHW